MGINTSVRSLGMGIPPLLSGFIAASITPEAPVIVSGLITLASGLVFIAFYRPPPSQRKVSRNAYKHTNPSPKK